MGAQFFYNKTRAFSMREAYNQLVEDAIYENGNDSYNGTISTTPGFQDRTAEYKKHLAGGGDFNSFYQLAQDKTSKFENCWGICLKEPKDNKLKIKSQVEHLVTPGTKRWELFYNVLNREGSVIASSRTKGEAVDLARAYTEKTKEPTQVTLSKNLMSCSPVVARIKYKADPNMSTGDYAFFGWASC
jgi:hypothetical protein